MSPGRVPTVLASAVLLPAALAVACSASTSGPPPAPPGDLGAALAQVSLAPGTGGVPTVVQFGRPVAALEAGTTAGSRYTRAIGWGTGSLAPYARVTNDVLGFDPDKAAWAVTAGSPPHDATMLSGMPSLAAVGTRSRALHASVGTRNGQTTYRFRPDNRISLSDPLGQAFGGVSPNLLGVDGHDLRVARSAAALDTVSGSSDNAANDPRYRALARCLGDPLAALLSVPARTTGNGIAATAAGLGGRSGVVPVERLCVLTARGRTASVAAAIRTALASGTDRAGGQRWAQILSAVSTSTSGTLVSVTARPAAGAAGGVLLAAAERGDLPGVGG